MSDQPNPTFLPDPEEPGDLSEIALDPETLRKEADVLSSWPIADPGEPGDLYQASTEVLNDSAIAPTPAPLAEPRHVRNRLAQASSVLGLAAILMALGALAFYATGNNGRLLQMGTFIAGPAAVVCGHLAWSLSRWGVLDNAHMAKRGLFAGYAALLIALVAGMVGIILAIGEVLPA